MSVQEQVNINCIIYRKAFYGVLISQVVSVLRWVNNDLRFHEEFIGLSHVPSIEASSLVFVVKDSLLCLNLTLANVRGQFYDGASNMSGLRNEVTKQIQDEESRAIYNVHTLLWPLLKSGSK